jgi:hypothetical protein
MDKAKNRTVIAVVIILLVVMMIAAVIVVNKLGRVYLEARPPPFCSVTRTQTDLHLWG